MGGRIEARLLELGMALPERCTPRGNFLPYRIEGNLVFLAGQICEWNGSVPYSGPVIMDGAADTGISLDAGRKAAEICALNLLFHLRDACGGQLDRVARVVRVGGFVNCLSGFSQSPAVINGASDLFIALWGENGRHARTAVGVAGLPANASVEVDAIMALDD
ncbi:RidA family protein [Ferrovibrio terrae]|uniref:RidA family protein n=1 Tax=Ferrovibrio terrae TaxID=2594003 RepID=UPI0031384029